MKKNWYKVERRNCYNQFANLHQREKLFATNLTSICTGHSRKKEKKNTRRRRIARRRAHAALIDVASFRPPPGAGPSQHHGRRQRCHRNGQQQEQKPGEHGQSSAGVLRRGRVGRGEKREGGDGRHAGRGSSQMEEMRGWERMRGESNDGMGKTRWGRDKMVKAGERSVIFFYCCRDTRRELKAGTQRVRSPG